MAYEEKKITIAELLEKNRENVTILDIREEAEVKLGSLEGSLFLPFSRLTSGIDEIPSDRPVYVLCRTGEISEEVTELLNDRGYDAYNIEGGYAAYLIDRIKNQENM